MAKKFGADIGYSKVRIILDGNDTVYSEAAVVAVSVSDGSVVACGNAALAINERVPGSVKLVRPFSGEMTPEAQYVTAYFSYVIKRLKMRGASLLLSFSGANDGETETVYVRAIQKAGAGAVSVIDPVYAAAQGCGVLGVEDSAVVNIGASVTDMACYRRNEQVASSTNSFAGNAFDRAIISDLLKNRRYRLSPVEAERLKIELASLSGVGDKTAVLDVIRPGMGLPKKLTVTEKEISASCETVFENLADGISDMLRTLGHAPDKIILTGGSAAFKGLPNALAPLMLIPIEIAPEPENAIIRGIGKMLYSI